MNLRNSDLQFVYPYEIDAENGIRIVSFPDVPGTLTQVDAGDDFDVVVACLGRRLELAERGYRADQWEKFEPA